MNDLSVVLFQLKITGVCVSYSDDFNTDDFIELMKGVSDELNEYAIQLVDNNEDYTFVFGMTNVFRMVIDYLNEKIEDDIAFEDQISGICLHFQNLLYIEKNKMFIEAFEILSILVRLLGTPVPIKKFQNSDDQSCI